MANRCHITVLGVSLEQGISEHSITSYLGIFFLLPFCIGSSLSLPWRRKRNPML